LSSGDWNEERKVQVTSSKPVQVEFHRPWNGSRRISGRLTLSGAPYAPSPTLVARAWGPKTSDLFPPAFRPVVQNNGSFEIAFDAESVSMLFIDRDQQLSGVAQRAHDDAKIDVTMEPTATHSGTLVDDNAQPVAGRTVEMYATTSDFKPIAAEQTDKAGRFRFTGVPSQVPLQFRSRHEPGDPDCYIVDGDRLFNAGEIRENDRLKLHRDDSTLIK
jgi:hypothetical protein